MNCYNCDKNIKNQSIKYIKQYIISLGIIMSSKGLPKELIDIIISCLVNEKGHCIRYQIKDRYGDYSHSYYKVCSPCFQCGISEYLNTHYTKILLPNMRWQKYFAKVDLVDNKKCNKIARKFLLKYFAGNYDVDYYRKSKPTKKIFNGKMFYIIDYI